MSEASQEVEVTVEGTVMRLAPCEAHAASASGMLFTDAGYLRIGEPVPEGARVIQNPNGYYHGCPDCAATPTAQETLERTVTRHVL